MGNVGQVGIVLILIVFAATYNGFRKKEFMNQYKFNVDGILIQKDYKRLLSSGFLHVNWLHVLFNMFALMSFSGIVELMLGGFHFGLIYFASLIGGNLLALFIHRNHGDYTAVGASGAVSGIIFAAIALFPGLEVGFPFIDFSIASWIFALVFVVITIYGIKSNMDNIGHEAHLGGALVGMLIAIIIRPESLQYNYIPIALLTIPTVLFILLITFKPHWLVINGFNPKPLENAYSIEHQYNESRKATASEIDRILEKISTKGMKSLSRKEKEVLDQHSKK